METNEKSEIIRENNDKDFLESEEDPVMERIVLVFLILFFVDKFLIRKILYSYDSPYSLVLIPAAMLLFLFVLIFFPPITTFLPNLVFGK